MMLKTRLNQLLGFIIHLNINMKLRNAAQKLWKKVKAFPLGLILVVTLVLILTVRGHSGTPKAFELSSKHWTLDGPFELSPERGRYALTYSIVEDQSFSYSVDIARFVTPDLGYKDGKYVSLFSPTVSFIVIPGYLLGKLYGLSQVGTFAIVALFALMNALLIRSIAMLLGANKYASLLGCITFIFATPAFAYATTLYQHHISVFLILMALYLLIKYNNLWSLFVIWFLSALSISVDNPNLFLMFPIGLVALARVISARLIDDKGNQKINIKIKPVYILSFFGLVLPILFFMWFNKASYGDSFQLGGTVASVKAIDEQGLPTAPDNANLEDLSKYSDPAKQDKNALRFFKARNILNGFYLHFFSLDRGIISYTPVMFIPLVGFFYLYEKKQKYLTLLLSIIFIDILLYSMWGDPWGGWAFGSRYLIPAYALLSIILALLVTKYKNLILMVIYISAFVVSVNINVAGALTGIGNPPQVEVLKLEELSGKVQKYTYERNMDQIYENKSKSYAFQNYFKSLLNAQQFHASIYSIVIAYTAIVIGKFTPHEFAFTFKRFKFRNKDK